MKKEVNNFINCFYYDYRCGSACNKNKSNR